MANAMAAARAHSRSGSLVSSCINISLLAAFHAFVPLVRAFPMPFGNLVHTQTDEQLPKSPDDASLWIYLAIAIALVLAGGIFAGLTIALMGQDEIYLQVLASSGDVGERKNAKRVLDLLSRGKHWVLVTLLLSNVITNETLPIVLDRSLGGGWPAVVSSTVLIVIFGEVVPQSICVRYGLPIGAMMAPMVLALMYIMGIAAWPTAKLLDYLLGEDHGTVYKKSGLKTLVNLHQELGLENERLNEDEVTIISAVLDLKAKAVGNIMTPMNDVFTMSSDTVLNEDMMDTILSAGYSRIPIHTPENKNNFVGMLLVKMLITYDPEDAQCVRDFALATLPETRPETSCLDILNFFQEGKSHMVLVSEFPAEARGAVGVVTLEDVIEELIGEEIIDESDVFIDVHKSIRRMAPSPRARVPKSRLQTDLSRKASEQPIEDSNAGAHGNVAAPRKLSLSELSAGQHKASFAVRRRSDGNKGNMDFLSSDNGDVYEHFRHLGPSNAAKRPKTTRINTVKIKPGLATGIPGMLSEVKKVGMERSLSQNNVTKLSHAPEGGIGEGLLSSAGLDASDGVHSLAVGYGTMASAEDRMSCKSKQSSLKVIENDPASLKTTTDGNADHVLDDANGATGSGGRSRSASTIASLHSGRSRPSSPLQKRHTARSGSISENVINVDGIKKIVLETTSSSDSEGKLTGREANDAEEHKPSEGDLADTGVQNTMKKRRKKRGKRKKSTTGEGSEAQPLLGGD